MLLKGTFAYKPFWIKCLIFAFLNLFGLLLWINMVWIFQLNDTQLNSIRLSQLMFSIFGLVFPALATAFLLKKDESSYLSTNTFPKGVLIVFAVLSIFLLQPFVNLITVWNEQITFPDALSTLESFLRTMEKMAEELTMRFLEGKSISDFLINLFLLALVPAISEELFFRGALQRLIGAKIGQHLAIWIVAIIFSAYHMQFFGFFPRIILGAFLGYLLLWSNSLYLPIIAHFINNATLVTFYFLSSRKIISFDIDNIGTDNEWWIGILSIVCVTPILFIMHKKFLSSKKDAITS